jgi:hypothetical protein
MAQNINVGELFRTVMQCIPTSLVGNDEKTRVVNMITGAIESDNPIASVVSGIQGSNSLFTNMVGTLLGSSIISNANNTNSFQSAMGEFGTHVPEAVSEFKNVISSLQEDEPENDVLPTLEIRDMMNVLIGGSNLSTVSSVWSTFDRLGVDIDANIKRTLTTLNLDWLMAEITIKLLMENNDIQGIIKVLEKGLNPNSKIDGKFLVCFCRSAEMLDMLVEYGLDLSKNHPLVEAKYDIMVYMIQKYGIDFLDGYEEQDSYNKLKYLNPKAKNLQKGLKKNLRKTGMLEDMVATIVGYIVPAKELRQNDQFVKMYGKAMAET